MIIDYFSFQCRLKVAMEAGATEYLVKPSDLGIFTETVGQLLNKNEPENSLH
jgi:DNA-binding response OmpR family regulator